MCEYIWGGISGLRDSVILLYEGLTGVSAHVTKSYYGSILFCKYGSCFIFFNSSVYNQLAPLDMNMDVRESELSVLAKNINIDIRIRIRF